MAHARSLHEDHGKNIQDTERLGAKIGITPLETAAVDKLHDTGAEQLAKLVPLTGDTFDRAFKNTMASAHREALTMVDGWIAKVNHAALKQHLTETRQHIERHLKDAERQAPKR